MKEMIYQGPARIHSIYASKDSKHILFLSAGVVSLLNLDTSKVIREYTGGTSRDFIIKTTFGGVEEELVLSGSEGTQEPAQNDSDSPM